MQPEAIQAQRKPLSPEDLRQLYQHTGVDQTVDTNEAAALLGKQAQTLRRWNSQGSGPIRPVNVNGRLRWRVADIKAVLAGGSVVT